MGVPYETPPISGIRTSGGQTVVKAVPFFNRTFINKLIVVQISGALVAFTVEMFNNKQAMEGEAGSASAPEPDTGEAPLNLFRIGPVMNNTGPGLLEYFSEDSSGGRGLMFYSQDADDANKSSKSNRHVYVKITTQGAGAQQFALVIGGEQEIG